ncbi:MAG: hypothetical protein ACRDRO_28035 [Pseudonocardiaceae bacterium]
MIEPENVASDLPELDHTDDPRGGAVAWALLTTGAVMIGSFSAVVWVW